ncbi:MAG: tRNA uridine-5-carboxymethylaminomethyl(34) synthesis GTPase MnmE, partial [Kiritimatiellaeota bacterium]|nr:tRNA uridine-5-carboxymethylaminomethyl(34) synthesis GTPase MnmE [Kiritimatiellota bacterium]
MSTIAAICTAPGKSAIAIVRVSGTEAFRIADTLCPGVSLMRGGTFKLFNIEQIGDAVVLAFRAPHSYTGEDVVEFQTHGGAMSAARVLDAVLAQGAVHAEAGEFTKRAFLNGRLDLSAAEAVMDLISAESERSARAAAEQLGGALGRKIDALLDSLLAVCADIEASLDFADDEANSILAPARVPERLAEIRAAIRELSATWREGRLLREGALVVLSGAPNAGKST